MDRLGEGPLDGDVTSSDGPARRRTAADYQAAAIEAHFRAHQWRKLALAYEEAAKACEAAEGQGPV